ncbi:MAG TPA: hypothetical protein ENN80_00235 [Candidatus Hydrogenedentes bacterium]|nr:hypothetical protein [Candidatus Hydrogenedentota bacterium]
MRIVASLSRFHTVFALICVAVCSLSVAEDEPEPLHLTGADALMDEQGLEDFGFEKKSFWFIASTNYHLRLEESEKQIDTMLNDTFGRILPNWKRPRTFKDWCEEMRVWDVSVGYGRDINAKASWTVYGGGGYGTVQNSPTYKPLGLKMRMTIDFTRFSGFLGTSVNYYPLGRPELEGRGLRAMLKGTRPAGEMNIGYNYQVSQADVRIAFPIVGNIAHVEQDDCYHLFWTSPRVGFEMPLAESYSLYILGGYLFFFDHAPEFNGYMVEFLVRRRF